jgi:glucose-1-phosphate thymidylyltransferase
MAEYAKGVVLAGGNGTRMGPSSNLVNKHCQLVFDKPMVYYPISTLMLCGIREIAVVVRPQDADMMRSFLGDGRQWGVELRVFAQAEPRGIVDGLLTVRDFIAEYPTTLILGDNIFHGSDMGRTLAGLHSQSTATVLAVRNAQPELYASLQFDSNGTVEGLYEKRSPVPSPWVVPGLYLYPADVIELAKSVPIGLRGEFEITDLNNAYLTQTRLRVAKLSRSSYWVDAGSPDTLLEAANYVAAITHKTGALVSSPEEVAYRQGWISGETLMSNISRMPTSIYSTRLERVVRDEA